MSDVQIVGEMLDEDLGVPKSWIGKRAKCISDLVESYPGRSFVVGLLLVILLTLASPLLFRHMLTNYVDGPSWEKLKPPLEVWNFIGIILQGTLGVAAALAGSAVAIVIATASHLLSKNQAKLAQDYVYITELQARRDSFNVAKQIIEDGLVPIIRVGQSLMGLRRQASAVISSDQERLPNIIDSMKEAGEELCKALDAVCANPTALFIWRESNLKMDWAKSNTFEIPFLRASI